MSTATFDHLVVACATLDQGVRWCEATLGVTPGPGGRHAAFGTHNRLVRLDNEDAWPYAFLELIAIDPEAPPPGRLRWFDLDNPSLQARLRDDGPQLVHFVARSTMASDTCPTHRPGCCWARSASTPDTRGAAIEVPMSGW